MKKSEKPSLKKNFIYRLFYDMLTVITPFITTPYISRVLGANGVGIYSYTNSIVTYFTLFAALGTLSYGAREIAQHRDSKEETSKIFWEIAILTFVTSTVCILVWCIVILFSSNYRYYFIASLPLILATMFDISWYFTGLERVKNIVIRNSLCKIISIICIFLFVNDKNDVIFYILINSAVNLIGNLSMWTYLPSMLVKVDWKDLHLKKHFKETLVYFVPTIATSIYTVLDKTLIGIIIKNDSENGYYEQATKVINIVKNLVFTSVNFVMGARMSYLFSKNEFLEIKEKIKRSIGIILFLGFASMFGIIGIAKNFVPLFFGDGYDPVINLLYCMSPLIVIIGISNCLGSQYYTPSGKRAQSAKYIIFGSVVNLIVNCCLIPFLSSSGAVFGSIVAELLISILYIKNCDNFISSKDIVKIGWKKMISGIIMCICIVLMEVFLTGINSVLLLVMQLLVGVCIYVVILLIMHDEVVYWFIGMVKNFIIKSYGKVKKNG